MNPKVGGFESPSGWDIFGLKNFVTFTRTPVHVSKMNAAARVLTFQILTLLQKYPTPLSSNHISNMSHPSYPYINAMHSTSPPPIHPCPMPWCHNCPLRVLMSLAPTHSTSSFPFLFLDLLWSPTTSHILVLKSTINTIPFPWLAHNSIKFHISSKIDPLSCLVSKPFLAPCYGYTTTITTHFPSTNISIRSRPPLSPFNVSYIKFSLTTTPTPPTSSRVPRQIH